MEAMMLRRFLLAAMLALMAVLAAVSVAQAGVVSVTPVTPYLVVGSPDSWYAQFNTSDSDPTQTYQVAAKGFIYSSNCNCGWGPAAGGVIYPAASGNVNGILNFVGNVTASLASCPFPGVQWFGSIIQWQSRQFVAALGQWTGWSNWAQTPVSAGWYGNGCP